MFAEYRQLLGKPWKNERMNVVKQLSVCKRLITKFSMMMYTPHIVCAKYTHLIVTQCQYYNTTAVLRAYSNGTHAYQS